MTLPKVAIPNNNNNKNSSSSSSSPPPPPLLKTLRNRIIEIQPSTPTKIHEVHHSSHSTMTWNSPFSSPDQTPYSLQPTTPLRRSSRLASRSPDPDKGKNVVEVDDSRVLDSKKRRLSLPDSVEKMDMGSDGTAKPPPPPTMGRTEVVDLCSSGDEKEEEGKIKLGIDLNSLAVELEGEEDGNGSGFLNLRSGSRIFRGKMDEFFIDQREGEGVNVEADTIDGLSSHVNGSGRYSREEKGNGSGRYSREEKGKGKLIKETPVELDLFPVTERLMKDAVIGLTQLKEIVTREELEKNLKKENIKMELRYERVRRTDRREGFRRTARKNASRFAHFRPEDRNNNNNFPPPEREIPLVEETSQELEDWPGPISTAMKIIKERKMKELGTQPGNHSSGLTKPVPVIDWIPSKDQSRNHSKSLVPSLQQLSMSVLSKNSDAILSLELVPEVLKHKLSRLVCDSRKMNARYMELLIRGSPTEIRVNDCSSIHEEELSRILQGCKTENLAVLQLDLCGRCMPDYILRATLAQSPNSLPALVTVSLKGACRLSDVGLKTLVASAPALRSINLEQCSLLTSDAINTLADSLGSLLRELYIDDCQSIDAMVILPALKKLQHLEVLSVARVRNVCDDFVRELVSVHGPNMKELVFSDCGEMTDTSLKFIAETCSGLRSLDLVNLCKLTDCAIGYLANGCQSIHTLKLCRNAFSDEAIAAFLEVAGASLTELSLNNVKKVGHHTAISLAKCSRKLQKLDLSFCRKLTDEALGLIIDSCLALKVLKLFGCTQISNVFLDGHSNPNVEIIGLKLAPFSKISQHF